MNFDEYAKSIGLSENEIASDRGHINRALWVAAQAQQREADVIIVREVFTQVTHRESPNVQLLVIMLRDAIYERIRAGGA